MKTPITIRNFYFLFFFLFIYSLSFSQNVGIGTSTPAEKLHIAGTVRVDDLQSPTVAAATTDKIVWVDANGKVYSFPTGVPGRVLGLNGAGVLSWLNAGLANSLNNGQIWIGDASNTPSANTPSGDALISNTGVITIQDDAVDGTDITITGESNGSLMYFDGTNWVNIGIGSAGQVLTISGGVPAWVNLPAAPITGDLTSGTTGVTVTGGTGAVLGTGTTVNVATNALGQNGLVPGPTAANALQVWGTDAVGNPGWIDPSSLVDVDNGLHYDGVAGKIRQGGALVENTSIDEGNFNYVHELNGTGVFEVKNGASGSGLFVNASNNVGIGTAVPTGKFHAEMSNGRFRTFNNAPFNATVLLGAWEGIGGLAPQVRYAGALGGVGFIDIGQDVNGSFVIEGNDNPRMVVENTGNVGINTSTPNPSALLQVAATDKGVLIPNVALTDITVAAPITAPATSLLVYNTATAGVAPNDVTPGYYYWDGAAWRRFDTGNNVGDWKLDGNTNAALKSIGTNDNFDLPIETNGTEKMRATTSGKLLLGTTIPGPYQWAKLEIADENGANSDMVMRVAGNGTWLQFLMQASSGTLASPTAKPANSLIGVYDFDAHDGTNFQSVAQIWGYTGTGYAAGNILGSMDFLTRNTTDVSPQRRMTVHATGNVGINNTNPTNKLDIQNTGRSGTHPTGLPLYVTTNSNFASNGVEFRHSNGTQGIGFGFNTIYATGTNASQDLGLQALGTGGNLLFTTNALERMRVAANGTVGINTTAPDGNAKLHINSGAILLSSGGMSSAFTNLPAAQPDNTDFHLFTRTTRPAPNATASDLRLYIEDDGSDAFSIYGNSCGGGGCFNLNNSKQVITFQGDGKIGVNTTAPAGRVDVTGPFYNIANAYKDWSQTSTSCFWGTVAVFTQCFTPTQNGVVIRMDVYFETAPAGTYTLTINGQSAVVVNPPSNSIVTFTFPTPPPVTGGVNTIWTLSSTVAYNMYGNCGGGCGNGTGGATYWNEIYIAPTGILNSNLFVSDVNGLVGVNTKTPSANLDVVGMMRVTGTFVNASDRRLKKDITTIENPLGIIQQLRGVNYYWDKDKFPEKQFSEKAQIGFIAQEVEAVLPQVVSTASDGYKGIEYGNMTAVLVEAVKVQQQQIDVQQQEIQRLRGLLQKMADVEARLSALDGKSVSAPLSDSPLIAPQITTKSAESVYTTEIKPKQAPILMPTKENTAHPVSPEQLKLLHTNQPKN